ncbi:lipopolysaccharide biosynthesis protein [Cellulomonas fengjieae]|uniref:lipopolysaccharide biosynthesis protein n=1 Tax=Cellulomonas fengjieae TaxID=2819978 RepID=UPI001AAFE5FD|nr:hypothetical protein [Cellulomonas fengjieae]MBO3101418.1 hypothetical protein [Cellulomonas fengjieae]
MRRSDSPTWVALGALTSGAATYVLLVVTARAVGPAAYGRFSLFWAAIIITSLGAFLPFEQVLARRSAGRRASAASVVALRVSGTRLALVVAAIAIAVHTVIQLVRGGSTDAVVISVVAFALACLGYAWQFPSRGVLAGRTAFRQYAVVVVVDAGLRAVLALVLWAAGVHSVGPYVAAVAASSLVCGAVGAWLVHRWDRHAPATPVVAEALPRRGATLAHEVGGLVVAMLCMQALLNSGLVVAGAAGTGQDAVVAGHLLAALTLARLPVFVLQAAQAAYVSRIADLAHRREHAALRRLLLMVASAVLAMAAATVLVAAAVGPQLVSLVFGPDYTVSRAAVTLVAGGIAAYLVASVTNDVAVALGAHRWTSPAWVCALLTAVVVAVAVPDLIVRSALPLLVGSLTAAAVLLPVVIRRARPDAPAW